MKFIFHYGISQILVRHTKGGKLSYSVFYTLGGGGGCLLKIVFLQVLRTETPYDVLRSLHQQGVRDIKTEAEKQLLNQVVLTRYRGPKARKKSTSSVPVLGCLLFPVLLVRYNNRSYKIDDILFEESPKSTFLDSRTGKLVSEDFFLTF